jgi:hypothetical protein
MPLHGTRDEPLQPAAIGLSSRLTRAACSSAPRTELWIHVARLPSLAVKTRVFGVVSLGLRAPLTRASGVRWAGDLGSLVTLETARDLYIRLGTPTATSELH